eukprot:1149872-Pelagomonas_calceolata.AAC.1
MLINVVAYPKSSQFLDLEQKKRYRQNTLIKISWADGQREQPEVVRQMAKQEQSEVVRQVAKQEQSEVVRQMAKQEQTQ